MLPAIATSKQSCILCFCCSQQCRHSLWMTTGPHAPGVTHPNQQRLVVALAVVGVVRMAATAGAVSVVVGAGAAVVAPQGQKRPGRVTGHAPTATTSVLRPGNALHKCRKSSQTYRAFAVGLVAGGLLKAWQPLLWHLSNIAAQYIPFQSSQSLKMAAFMPHIQCTHICTVILPVSHGCKSTCT